MVEAVAWHGHCAANANFQGQCLNVLLFGCPLDAYLSSSFKEKARDKEEQGISWWPTCQVAFKEDQIQQGFAKQTMYNVWMCASMLSLLSFCNPHDVDWIQKLFRKTSFANAQTYQSSQHYLDSVRFRLHAELPRNVEFLQINVGV